MTRGGICYSYGPVPSRRLGKSMGINNIPAKVCSYSCVYCQVGRTTRLQTDRRAYYAPKDILSDVRSRVEKAQAAAEQVDYLAFVPDGEPTLDLNLGKEIRLLKALGIPVGVITNSSLLWREDVQEELGQADWVSLKIDAVSEAVWRRSNRPHKALRLSPILDGILAFAQSFTGKLVTETMLVSGLNDQPDCARAVAEFIGRVAPSRAYLSIPTRPPAEKWARVPDEEALNRVYQVFTDKVKRVEYLVGYEGNAFACTGDVEKDLLSITAVHPMRAEAVGKFLFRSGSSWEVIERLVAQGDMAETKFEGHTFYLKRFAANHETLMRNE